MRRMRPELLLTPASGKPAKATGCGHPAPIAAENTLRLRLTNLRSVQVDVVRAALDAPAELTVETVSDGDITLDLFGVFPGDTEIYEDGVRLCAADGATVGSVGARVPVKGGTHV